MESSANIKRCRIHSEYDGAYRPTWLCGDCSLMWVTGQSYRGFANRDRNHNAALQSMQTPADLQIASDALRCGGSPARP